MTGFFVIYLCHKCGYMRTNRLKASGASVFEDEDELSEPVCPLCPPPPSPYPYDRMIAVVVADAL